VAILDWPSAIHDGGGKAVFVVPEEVTEEQLGAMAQIFTGQLGGMPSAPCCSPSISSTWYLRAAPPPSCG
jgi:hypothetical protein